MRIAYIVLYMDDHQFRGGVGQKINTQMESWRRAGHEVMLFTMSPDEIGAGVSFRYRPMTMLPLLKDLSRFFSRSRAMTELVNRVKQYQPDLIYLRHGRYTFPIHQIFKFAPVVMELNTYDVAESRHQGHIVHWINQFTRNILFRNASGLVSTSREIVSFPENAVYSKPVCVIGNGIDLRTNHPIAPPKNEQPIIAMVASPGMSWHGVDKLIHLAVRFPDLRIHIIGYRREDVPDILPPNVHVFGFVPRDNVRQALQDADVTCGTLALHRKKMQEASPLKAREAVAYGIPLILGYTDTDLSGIDTEYILQIPNTEDNVETHGDQIQEFAYKMMGRRIDRKDVMDAVDLGHKEETRLKFFEKILGLGA